MSTIYCTYVGVAEEDFGLSGKDRARVLRARGNTDEALNLERDVRQARANVKSTACTCKGSHGHEHPNAPNGCAPQCAKRLARDHADRLQRMEDMVTGRIR